MDDFSYNAPLFTSGFEDLSSSFLSKKNLGKSINSIGLINAYLNYLNPELFYDSYVRIYLSTSQTKIIKNLLFFPTFK